MTLPAMLQQLPEHWERSDLSGTRINLMREGVVTLVGLKKLESEALFVSSEGGGTLRETAKVEFAGKERYWWIARKVNGVIRRVLLTELKVADCTVDEPCVQCAVCGLLGGLNTQTNNSLFSRVKLQDLISVQEYVYDEKFRIRQPDDPTDPDANPTPFQEVVVPPGTEFPFVARIIKPSRRDLGLFLFGNRIADGLGYGNYSKLRGDATTRWLLLANGFAHISVHDLLEQFGSMSIEAQVSELAANPTRIGLEANQVLHGTDLASAIDELLASVKP